MEVGILKLEFGMRKAEVEKQSAEGRGQKAENRRQNWEVGMRKAGNCFGFFYQLKWIKQKKLKTICAA